MEKRKFNVLFHSVLLSTLTCICPPAMAQQAAPLVPINEQAGNFDTAVQAISEQTQTSIVAEGRPLHSEAPPAKPSINLASVMSQGTIEKIAAAYDYNASYHSGVWRLTKRYSDPNDLPEVTQDECIQAMQDVVKVMKPYATDATWPPNHGVLFSIVPQIVATLTPGQVRQLQKGDLPITSLNADQQALAWKFALYFYDQKTLNVAQLTLGTLKNAVAPAIGEGMLSGKYKLFGYQVADTSEKATFVPFAHNLTVYPDGSYTDPSGPAPPPVSQKSDEFPLEGLTTLEGEAEALNKRGAKIEVDPALKPLPVFIAGDNYATPDQILDGMAAVYGLRVYKHDDGTLQLTRPLYEMPANISGLGDAVWHVLPAPLLRAIHKGEPVKPVDQATLTNPKVSDAQIVQQMQGNRALPGEIHKAALLKLRRDVARYQAEHKSTDPAPLSALSEADREAFAVALMTDFLQSALEEYDRPVPFYVTNFDQLVLRGGPYEKPDNRSHWKFALNFALPDGNGGMKDGPGMFDMPYVPPSGGQ